jgi:ABC-type nickel/cobalt efflux system permease component RcnA
MSTTSVPLLLAAAGSVGFLHSILPDHWVPLAVVGRTQRWGLVRVARTSLLASIGHVLTSIILAGIIALVGLQFRSAFESQQAHIVGVILAITGIAFLIWGLTGHGHGGIGHHRRGDEHGEHQHDHHHDHGHTHTHHEHLPQTGQRKGNIAAILIPFGAAASPDLTVLPVALAASAVSVVAVGGVLLAFSLVTLLTFVVLTVAATKAGYQVKGVWLEEYGNAITGGVLVLIGLAVFLGFV